VHDEKMSALYMSRERFERKITEFLSMYPKYSYEEAVQYVKNKYDNKIKRKIEIFNHRIPTALDANGMPKLIHLTCRNKNQIDNEIWIECLQQYRQLYPDYSIILYDNEDIYRIIERFDKNNLNNIKKISIGAVLADVFRYLILYLRGGYYSDMDCFPTQPFEKLSEIQYHGNSENKFYIYPRNQSLPVAAWDFYENPCSHCVVHTENTAKTEFICLGHQYILPEKTRIIVGKEYDRVWHEKLITNEKIKHLWTDQDVGICQWCMAAKPEEKLFLHCYLQSIENINTQTLNPRAPDYHYQVLNTTGPLFFTKMIHRFLSKDPSFREQIAMLPCDYFCCLSYDTVPVTKNRIIQHKFTGCWLLDCNKKSAHSTHSA